MRRAVVLAIATLALGLCWPSTARSGSTPGPNPQEGQKPPQPVTLGQPAPFDGLLLDPLTAAKLTAKAEFCDDRVATVRDEAAEKLGLTIEFHTAMRTNDQQAFDKQLKLVEDELAPHWYNEPALWFAGGVVVTVAVTVLAVVVLDEVRADR
jgi:hypothetical protein